MSQPEINTEAIQILQNAPNEVQELLCNANDFNDWQCIAQKANEEQRWAILEFLKRRHQKARDLDHDSQMEIASTSGNFFHFMLFLNVDRVTAEDVEEDESDVDADESIEERFEADAVQEMPNKDDDIEPWPHQLLSDIKPNLNKADIVRDLIPRGGFGEMHAEASGGKTAIAVDLALHIADGRPYRGRRVEQQPVVYVALEGHTGIENRIAAAREELEISEAAFALVQVSESFRDSKAARRTAALARLLMDRFGGSCPVIVIDTFMAALGAGGNDCDPSQVTEFIECVKRYMVAPGWTALILHHLGKDASRGARGWSGLNAALDFELEVDGDGDVTTLRVSKLRDGPDDQPAFCYRLHPHHLGENQYDEAVTAVVVEHLADEAEQKRSKKLSPKARAALESLWDCIKDKSLSWPMDEPGKRWTEIVTWEAVCCEPGAVSNSKNERDRRKKVKAARRELEESGTITIVGNNVYPTPRGTGRDDG